MINRQEISTKFHILEETDINIKGKEDKNQIDIKNNLSNNKTNSYLKNKYNKSKKEKCDENKNKNHQEIIIRTKIFNKTDSIIEVKLPNPYLDTECIKNNEYIDYNFKSKFKSKFADYINSKQNINNIKQEINSNKTNKFISKVDKRIYFTNLSSNKNKKYLKMI